MLYIPNQILVVILNGDEGFASFQDDSIGFKWWILSETGSYQLELKISNEIFFM